MSHLVLHKGPNPTFTKVITLGAQNTKVHIPTSTAYPLHAPEVVRLHPCLYTNNSVTCIWTDTTFHIAKTGLVTRMEILCRNTAMGPCKSCLKCKQPHHGIRNALVTRASHMLSHVFSDVHGLLATQSQNGHHLVTLINDLACTSSHGPHDESQVGQAFKTFVSYAQPSTRQKVKALDCNGSGKHKAGCLQQALHHAIQLHEASPTHTLSFFTLKKALSGNKPDIFQLCALSCKNFMHKNMRGRTLAPTTSSTAPLTASLGHAPLYSMKGGTHFIIIITLSSTMMAQLCSTATPRPLHCLSLHHLKPPTLPPSLPHITEALPTLQLSLLHGLAPQLT